MATSYTLDQLAIFTSQALEKEKMREGLAAVGASEDATHSILFSDSLRAGNVVRWFHDYGGLYGDDMDRYIDRFLKQAGLENNHGHRYTLGQLAWINVTGMFPENLQDKLIEMGEPEEVVESFVRACQAADGNVVKLGIRI